MEFQWPDVKQKQQLSSESSSLMLDALFTGQQAYKVTIFHDAL